MLPGAQSGAEFSEAFLLSWYEIPALGSSIISNMNIPYSEYSYGIYIYISVLLIYTQTHIYIYT